MENQTDLKNWQGEMRLDQPQDVVEFIYILSIRVGQLQQLGIKIDLVCDFEGITQDSVLLSEIYWRSF